MAPLTNSTFAGITEEANDTGFNLADVQNSYFESITGQGSSNAPTGMSITGIAIGDLSKNVTFAATEFGGDFTQQTLLVAPNADTIRFADTNFGNTLGGQSTVIQNATTTFSNSGATSAPTLAPGLATDSGLAGDRITKIGTVNIAGLEAGSTWQYAVNGGSFITGTGASFTLTGDGPKAVLLGSTNWTSTGLCAQTNNTIVLDDRGVATRYLTYWKQLAADTKSAKGIAKLLQALKFRTWNGKGKKFLLKAGLKLESWFSPNTAKARVSKAKNEKCPSDMKAVCDRINAAKHAILFLAFYPGTPSVANWSALALNANKKLFVRGCVTNKSASEGFYYQLKGMTPPKKVKGQKIPIKQDPRVIGAEAFDGTFP